MTRRVRRIAFELILFLSLGLCVDLLIPAGIPSTLTPESQAAVAFWPQAKSDRPKVERLRT